MAAINDLISQIQDETLRNRIQEEVSKMAKQKKFGLVFEEHMPESTPLYDMPIKRGCNVMLRDSKDDKAIYVVLKVEGDTAVCVKPEQKDEAVTFELKDIVRVAEFGESIYPYLKPLDSVCNAPDSDLWHTLIEADNYHALQLLEYLYAGKVDCIYIDPPYNTGAKDWKYNNDYVDGKGFCCNDGSLEAAQSRVMARAMKNNFQEGDSYEKMQFYYHPDHLGSSSYITNLDGEVVQHIEYVPFGEVFIEERNNIWNTPYLFNAKEFDEETGMYYYGARYYESRLSLWMSVDRFAEKYKTSPYCFTLDNPICHYDERGDSTILYATRLPMDNKKIQSALSMATHTFIVVKRNGKPSVKFSFGSKTDNPFGGQLVKVSYMDEEKSMKGEAPSNFVKNRIVITPPSGMTVEQFDEMVIKTGRCSVPGRWEFYL